jgi:predicted SAM-dependent methyltransferase
MKLTVGPGVHYAAGWVNAGLWGDPPPDVVCDGRALPFRDGAFERSYLGHVLEHVPWHDVARFVAEVRRVTAPGATVMAVGPCIHRVIETRQPRHITEAVLADPRDTSPEAHAWTATEALTAAAMVEGGLANVAAVPVASVTRPEWPNPSTAPWQCAVKGTA